MKLKTGPVLSTMFSRRWVDLNKFPVCISDVSDGPSINGVASSTPPSATKKMNNGKKEKKNKTLHDEKPKERIQGVHVLIKT